MRCEVIPTGSAPLEAIETAEKWTRGEATLEQVRDAAYAVSSSSASYASYAASSAAYAAYYGAYAAYACSWAAYYAAYACCDGKRTEILKRCADIVRKHIPVLPEGGAK